MAEQPQKALSADSADSNALQVDPSKLKALYHGVGLPIDFVVAWVTAFSPAAFLSMFGPLGFFFAGGICSSASHLLATPIDVVKTTQQADRAAGRSSDGMMQLLVRILRQKPASLWSGAGATFIGYFLHGAFKYGFYEILKHMLKVGHASLVVRVQLLCVCAFFAEFAATFVLCPAEAARVKVVTDPQYVEPKLRAMKRQLQQKSAVSRFTFVGSRTRAALQQLRDDEGIWSGWYGGIVPLLAKQCSYTVAKLVTYDVMSNFLSDRIWLWNPFLARSIAAVVAAATAAVASQPADTVFTCIATDGGECLVPKGDVTTLLDPPESIWAEMVYTARRLGLRDVHVFSKWHLSFQLNF
eukprot:CAMPEP_0117608240 /NCGR_PEP_ID=MMETSP0784-20121206/80707_1 /TAXON_ID=39447 /ORGANISM="" /LENGTH=354 /DNA_ID=CAMNT_0005411509 /DNA_START=282 /DNA_END=1347 /DNA_ORIENTATION=+